MCSPGTTPQPQKQPTNGPKKRKSEESSEVKEETVEEDGLFYGELDNDNMEYNEVGYCCFIVYDILEEMCFR